MDLMAVIQEIIYQKKVNNGAYVKPLDDNVT